MGSKQYKAGTHEEQEQGWIPETLFTQKLKRSQEKLTRLWRWLPA